MIRVLAVLLLVADTAVIAVIGLSLAEKYERASGQVVGPATPPRRDPATPPLPPPKPVEPPPKPVEPPAEPPKERPSRMAFTYRDSKAMQVFLVGDFNKWRLFDDPFVRQKDGKTWTCVKELAKGSYAYQYWVDGRLMKDPFNPRMDKGKSVITVPKPSRKPAP